MFRNQKTSSVRKIQVPGSGSRSGGEEHRQTNKDPIYSPISNSNLSQQIPLKCGYLDVHSGGNPKAPTHLYCVLSAHSLKCYADNPAELGRPPESVVPVYELKVRDYALTSTESNRPQAFALLHKNKAVKIEFMCRNIGAMNHWTSFLKVKLSYCIPKKIITFLSLLTEQIWSRQQ